MEFGEVDSIVTAPKDGTRILAWFPDLNRWQISSWMAHHSGIIEHWTNDGKWCPCDPTHWMKLPQAIEI